MENFLPVQKFVSRNAKRETENPHFGKIDFLSRIHKSFLLEN